MEGQASNVRVLIGKNGNIFNAAFLHFSLQQRLVQVTIFASRLETLQGLCLFGGRGLLSKLTP